MHTEPDGQRRVAGLESNPPGSRRGARTWRRIRRIAGGVRLIARGLAGTAHPLLAQIVPIRRCNIDCAYCNEYDNGLVHYCPEQRGTPGIPLDDDTRADIERAYRTPKGCAPFCTIGCVHRVSIMDFWRDPQTDSIGSREPQRRDG